MKNIIISVDKFRLKAQLNNSETAEKIYDALPIEGIVKTWGDEIYFDIPVEIDQAPDAVADVEVGALGYWSAGSAFCIFFGRTPVSTGDKPRAASPVNVFGVVMDDPTILKSVKDGKHITISRAKE
ncbi:hypothetical protein GF337_11140 [candidate division KSB1 bacterium]|nr:hypothetical protein [candidate division KSB1 bacterium]